MSYWENKDLYYKLLKEYCNFEVSSIDFERKFLQIVKEDEDALHEKSKDWERRFDIELQVERRESKISQEEFCKRWNDLWGITDNMNKLCDILDRVFCACDCFDPNISDSEANPPLDLSERLFREEVLSLYHELETFINKTRVNDV